MICKSLSFSFLSPTLFNKTLSLIKINSALLMWIWHMLVVLISTPLTKIGWCLNRLKHVMISIFLKITINNLGNIKTMLRRFVCRLILACFFFLVPESEYSWCTSWWPSKTMQECPVWMWQQGCQCFASSSFNHSYLNYDTTKQGTRRGRGG